MTSMVSGWKSSISGPIPPHPYYDSKSQSDYVNIPPNRIKGDEGAAIATKGHKGTVSVLLALDGKGVGPRPSSARTCKPPPKDHMKENWRRMRQIQKVSKNREAEKEQKQPVPVKALWKSEKYSDVPSRITETLGEPPAPRPDSRNFLRAHSRSGPSRPPSPQYGGQSPRPRTASSVSSSIPSASSAKDVELIRRDIDFIHVNGRSVKHTEVRRSPSASMVDDLKKRQDDQMDTYRKGVVPKYLDKRQKEWKADEERRIAEAPDPDCPADHKKMPEEERQKTLNLLRESEKKLIDQMNHLPVHNDTLRVRMKKQELDGKLGEIEEAMKIFSRPKVFVKEDS